MKKCPFCGEMNMDNAGFCGECGKNISQVAPERVNPTAGYQGGPSNGYQNPRGPQNGYRNPGRPMRRPGGFKMSKNMKIILAQVIVLVIAITAFCAIGSSKSSPEAAAEQYFHAMVNRDTETLYEMTVMSERKSYSPAMWAT